MNSLATIEAMWGDTPALRWLKGSTPEERVQLVDEMDACEDAITDETQLRLVAAEHRVMRMLIRMFAEAE